MQSSGTADVTTEKTSSGRSWVKMLPLALIVAGVIAALIFGRQYLSFAAIAEHYQTLIAWRDSYFIATIAVFMAVYIAAVAFSVPGAVWLTLIGGFLFGTVLGSVLVVTSATIGALLIFLAARTALGEMLRARASGWLSRMENGFADGAVSYLLIMRLVPVVPFFVANLAPAFFGVRTVTYTWTTLLGIIPGTVVYISIGSGLGEQLERGEAPNLGVIFEPHVLGPLLGLAVLAALPLLLRKLGVLKRGDQ
ncbi:MAG: TVP38/TMEM64 family protein [Pseudomonadota bacterium]